MKLIIVLFTLVIFANAKPFWKRDSTSNPNCKNFTNSYIGTRYWQINSDSNLTSVDVAAAFETGFAPQISSLSGFQEYLASIPSPTTNFFFNVFNSSESANATQSAAQSFVPNNAALSNQISPIVFGTGQYQFWIGNQSLCNRVSEAGFYLSTRLWSILPGANMTVSEVINQFEIGFSKNISSQPGFREYAGIQLSVNGTDHPFFYNIFETKQEANNANNLAANYVASGVLATQITKDVFTVGPIFFDILPSTVIS